MLRRAHLLPALLLAGCQTGGPSAPPAAPAVLQPLFMPCVPTDGALSVQLFHGEGGDTLAGSVELEWVAKPDGDWELEALNPVGLTVLRVARQGRRIAATGPLAGKLPPLAVEDEGYLTVDGARVGIKAGEVPCLLAARLPRAWLGQLASVESENDRVVLEVDDPGRTVTITARSVGAAATGQVCTRFRWRRYLVMRPSATWCLAFGSGAAAAARPQSTLRGVDDHLLKWVRIDD